METAIIISHTALVAFHIYRFQGGFVNNIVAKGRKNWGTHTPVTINVFLSDLKTAKVGICRPITPCPIAPPNWTKANYAENKNSNNPNQELKYFTKTTTNGMKLDLAKILIL